MGRMTGSGESSGNQPGDDIGEDSSVDSFLRDVAHAPAKAPLDNTAKSATAATPPKASLVPGALIAGRFRLERSLGEGGMGVVWQAVHSVTRKPVALKFLRESATNDPRAVQRFLREARAACAVRHPIIVAVHDVLELEDGSPVMVMDLLTGETFAERLAREGAMPLAEVALIMVHVCSAVGCAHALGIVHRDLKPENIFLARAHDGSLDVKVLDFGIAKLTASEGDAAHTGATTGTGAILGTPYYMAPEQLFGERDVDHRADIWALGIILYEALVGSRPTQAANIGQIFKLVTTGGILPLAERAPNLPGRVANLVSRMLSRDRALRPADVREVLTALSHYTDESFVPVEAAPIRAASLSDPSSPARVEPDSAPTSTVEAAAVAVRGSSPSNAGATPRRPIWMTVAVLGGVLLVGPTAGVVAWRAREASSVAPPATPATSSPEQPLTPEPPSTPSVTAVEPPRIETTSTPSSSTSTSPETSVASASSVRRTGPPASGHKLHSATSAVPSSSSPSHPVVDPGSYQ
jgi:eukaryotic-like serine/threonine-protein kinase